MKLDIKNFDAFVENASCAFSQTISNVTERADRQKELAILLNDSINIAISRGQFDCIIPHTMYSFLELKFMHDLAIYKGYTATISRIPGLQIEWAS